MATEFEDQDLDGAVFWGVSLRGATFRDVDLTGSRTHHVVVEDVEIDGFVDRLVVNGVDVTEFVRAGDPWQPLRGMLRPATADEVSAAWQETRRVWADTMTVASSLPSDRLHERIDDEWSFVETLRHLVFVVDKWVMSPFEGDPFHSIGLPNSGSADHPWPGLDPSATPDLDEVVAVREAQAAAIDRMLSALDDDHLAGAVEVPENGRVAVLDCWHALLEEEFEHRRYALRDLRRS